MALLKLAATDSQPALDRLISELNGKSADVRRAVFDALAAYFADQPMQAVSLGTQSQHADLREYALRSSHGLGLLGSPSCMRLIRRHLNDDAAEVRRMAFVLSLLTQPKIATVVRGLSEDVHRWLAELDKAKRSKPKRSEIDALEEQDLAPLIDAMSSWRTDIALLAARALAGLGDLRAFGVLLQVSRDPDEQNRIRVCQGFRTLADMNAVPRLVQMLRDPALNVADAAYTALSSLWRKTPFLAVDAGMQASEGKVRQRAVALTVKLVKAETKDALERLRHALDDSDPAVRREAFKAALNLGVGEDREATLRFALESAHADIRRDVLLELHEEKQSAWAQGILSDLLDDGDARIRRDSLKLLREVARDPIAVYGTALSSQRDDVRAQAARELSRLDFSDAIADLLATAITDPARDVRNNAMSGLVSGEAMPQLQAALKSEFADVRTAAALALAAHGLAAVKKPLLEVIGLPEPENKSERTTWKEQVTQALCGLGVLADPKTVDALLAMVTDPNGQFRDEAAAALFTVAGPKQQEAIATLYRQAEGSLKRTLGLALTATGSEHAAAAVLGKANADSFAAALMLENRDYAHAFLSDSNIKWRCHAQLLLMLMEAAERPPRPLGSLAGLAAEHLEIRFVATTGVEAYYDPVEYHECLMTRFNLPPVGDEWTVEPTVAEQVGALLAHTRVARVLLLKQFTEIVFQGQQEGFEHWWALTATRFAKELEHAMAKLAKLESAQRPDPTEFWALAEGSYLGIIRLTKGQGHVPMRDRSLTFLHSMVKEGRSDARTVANTVRVVLHDKSATLRETAFNILCELDVPPSELAAEALMTPHRDVARMAMNLLVDADADETQDLLLEVQATYENGMEEEATAILAKAVGDVSARASGLGARSPRLRQNCGHALSRMLQDGQDEAREAMKAGLSSSFPDVRLQMAAGLALVKDKGCVGELTRLLAASDRQIATQAVAGLRTFGGDAVPGIFLDHLEANKDSKFATDLLLGVAESGGKKELPRLLLLLAEKNLRRHVYDALLRLSGYHQDLDDPELEPLHDDRLLSLLQKLTEVGDERLLANLLPKAAKSANPDIEPLLGTLAVFKDDAVRHAAVSAAAWQLKEHGTCAEILRSAIAHEDATTKFLGAEGLAMQGHDDGIQVLLTGIDLLADAEHRQRAVTALGTLANERALDQLLRLATNEDHALREPAIEAIGHMREGEHAERVFNLLKEACTDYGLQPQALSGLRWFDSPAGWQLIRDAHKDSSWCTRQRVAELLEFDDDGQSIEILSSLITDEYDEDVIEAAAKSLRARFGPDSLEPDYIFLQCDEYMLNEFAPDHLARVCEKGDPARLLAIFAKIEEEKQDQIRNALLAWDPPPAEAAAVALDEEDLQLRKLALSVLGRAAHDPGAARLEELTARAWEEERRDDELLASLVWVTARLGQTPQIWQTILADQESKSVPVRRAVLMALVAGKLPKAYRPILEQVHAHGEAELSAIAARVLGSSESSRALRHVGTPADHLATLPDVAAVQTMLADENDVLTSPGLLEALGRMGGKQAANALVSFAKDESHDEELRKHAWRTLRQLKRRQA